MTNKEMKALLLSCSLVCDAWYSGTNFHVFVKQENDQKFKDYANKNIVGLDLSNKPDSKCRDGLVCIKYIFMDEFALKMKDVKDKQKKEVAILKTNQQIANCETMLMELKQKLKNLIEE